MEDREAKPRCQQQSEGRGRRCWIALGGLELLLMAFCLGLPRFVGLLAAPALSSPASQWNELLLVASVILAGWIVGAEFPVVNRLFQEAGAAVGTSAAATDAWDHLGAALGCLLIGVVLVPVLGIAVSCHWLAALKAAGLCLLLSAWLSLRPAPVAGTEPRPSDTIDT